MMHSSTLPPLNGNGNGNPGNDPGAGRARV